MDRCHKCRKYLPDLFNDGIDEGPDNAGEQKWLCLTCLNREDDENALVIADGVYEINCL
jgi:hypothetical protein